MKVDPDILSIHRGLPSSEEELVCEKPRVSNRNSEPHEERRPRSFIASVRARDDLVVSDGEEHEQREIVTDFSIESLVVNNLTEADLELISWSGSPLHVSHVAAELQRAERGTRSTSRPAPLTGRRWPRAASTTHKSRESAA